MESHMFRKNHIFKYIKKMYAKLYCIIKSLMYLKYTAKSQFGYIDTYIKIYIQEYTNNIFENILKYY